MIHRFGSKNNSGNVKKRASNDEWEDQDFALGVTLSNPLASTSDKKIGKKLSTRADLPLPLSELDENMLWNRPAQKKSKMNPSKPSKVPADINSIVMQGNPDDLNYLYDRIDKFYSRSSKVAIKCQVMAPMWSLEASSRFSSWAKALGFQEKCLQTGVIFERDDHEKIQKLLKSLHEAISLHSMMAQGRSLEIDTESSSRVRSSSSNGHLSSSSSDDKSPMNSRKRSSSDAPLRIEMEPSTSYTRPPKTFSAVSNYPRKQIGLHVISNDSTDVHFRDSGSTLSNSPVRRATESPTVGLMNDMKGLHVGDSYIGDSSRTFKAAVAFAFPIESAPDDLADLSDDSTELDPDEPIHDPDDIASLDAPVDLSENIFEPIVEQNSSPIHRISGPFSNPNARSGIAMKPVKIEKVPDHQIISLPTFWKNPPIQPIPIYRPSLGKNQSRGEDAYLSDDSAPRTRIHRAATMPMTSTLPVCPKTPAGESYSQNDAEFCTPSSVITKITSGINYDWGISAAANKNVCDKLYRRYETMKVARPNLHRSSTTSALHSNDDSPFSKISPTYDIRPKSSLENKIGHDFHSTSSLFDKYAISPSSMRKKSNQKDKRQMKSHEKWRRISIGYRKRYDDNESSMLSDLNGNHLDHSASFIAIRRSSSSSSSLSPGVLTKYSTSKNSRLIKHRQTDALDEVEETFPVDRDIHEVPTSILQELNERSFKVAVIGGNYQHSFQGVTPVVAPPQSSQKRINHVYHCPSDDTLSLKLFLPKDNIEQVIRMDSSWTCLRASPVGYIILKDRLRPGVNTVGYFVTKHPLEWSEDPVSISKSSSSGLKSQIHPYDRLVADGSHIHDLSFMSTYSIPRGTDDDAMNVSTDEHNISTDSIFHQPFHEEDELDRSPSSYWSNSLIISLVFEYLVDFSAVIQKRATYPAYQSLNKSWAIMYYRHIARHRSLPENIISKSSQQFVGFLRKFSVGKFISEGACKKVFYLKNNGREDALSITDLVDMRQKDMDEAITLELEIAMICSSLYSLNICPNLVSIYSLFQCPSMPPADWSIKAPVHSLGRSDKKEYQYVRMEFCSGGDLDSRVETMLQLHVNSVRVLLFQMIFALYSCREQLSMRHFDIKLLNFLVTSGKSLLQSHNHIEDRFEKLHLVIGFGQYIYRLPVSMKGQEVVKLTDFGTSLIGAGGLGDPISPQQFTTLENTPVEFFLLGSDARQSYSADTFCLGLSFFHLLIGHHPYEEHLKDVKCPSYLASLLNKYFGTNNVSSPYFVIKEVIESLDMSDKESHRPYPGMIMYHTLYRYLVLFGVPSEFQSTSHVYSSSPVWKTLTKVLNLSNNDGKHRKLDAKSAECVNQYKKDCSAWSIREGTNPAMMRFRDRLHALGDEASKLLAKMVHYDPSRRCSTHEALIHPLFDCLRDTRILSSDYTNVQKHEIITEEHVEVTYLHYYRSKLGVDSLPMI